MPKKRHDPDEIIRKLCRAESRRTRVGLVGLRLRVSGQTFHRCGIERLARGSPGQLHELKIAVVEPQGTA